jgi:hypothetical protein
MNQEIKIKNNELKFEWGCRIMLTLCILRLLSGYVVFIQTKHQLVSPLIPQSIIYEISAWYIQASLISGVIFMAAIWFYFFNKKIPSLVAAGVCILAYEILIRYLPSLII